MKLLVLLTALSSLLTTLQTRTLQSDISLSVQEQGQAALTFPGKIVMLGERFKAQAKGFEVAYDGTTFYLYDPDARELTLSRPGKEELMAVNPMLYAKTVSQVSDIRESVNKDGTVTTVVVVPKGMTDEINKVTLKIKNATAADALSYPLSVEIKEPTRTTTLKLKNPAYTQTTPLFTVKKDDAYINDLR